VLTDLPVCCRLSLRSHWRLRRDDWRIHFPACPRRAGVGFANSSAARWGVGAVWFAALVVVEERCLLGSFVYLVVRNLFALVWLLARPRRSRELEILVLRHELAVLRWRAADPDAG
jgi:hypothetical protein